MHTIENRNGHCAFILSGADINNEPSSCTKHFYCPNIHRAIWEFSGPKTKQKNGTIEQQHLQTAVHILRPLKYLFGRL